jgi:hypothetical protein
MAEVPMQSEPSQPNALQGLNRELNYPSSQEHRSTTEQPFEEMPTLQADTTDTAPSETAFTGPSGNAHGSYPETTESATSTNWHANDSVLSPSGSAAPSLIGTEELFTTPQQENEPTELTTEGSNLLHEQVDHTEGDSGETESTGELQEANESLDYGDAGAVLVDTILSLQESPHLITSGEYVKKRLTALSELLKDPAQKDTALEAIRTINSARESYRQEQMLHAYREIVHNLDAVGRHMSGEIERALSDGANTIRAGITRGTEEMFDAASRQRAAAELMDEGAKNMILASHSIGDNVSTFSRSVSSMFDAAQEIHRAMNSGNRY